MVEGATLLTAHGDIKNNAFCAREKILRHKAEKRKAKKEKK